MKHENMTMDETYDFLLWDAGVPGEALDLAFGLLGYNYDTAIKILAYYTGYDSFAEYRTEELGG